MTPQKISYNFDVLIFLIFLITGSLLAKYYGKINMKMGITWS